MTDQELRRLSRKRLLEMLAEQTGKANRLERENERLKTRIADRERHLTQMGELTEAILHGGGAHRHTGAAGVPNLRRLHEPHPGRGRHQAALSGAGKPGVRHGRQPQRVHRFQKHHRGV